MSAAAGGAGRSTRDEATVLDVEHLDVTLTGSRILLDVNLHVDAGEFVALLGSNGSGKSTLVRTVVGAIPPTRGRVELFGQDVTRRRAVPWRRLGYVPQRSTATAGVPSTVTEVVQAGLLTGSGLLRPRDARRRALAALELVDLAGREHDPIATLSGGQQQRALIARALARTPDLLVLDEPLAGIDSANQAAFARTLSRLRDTSMAVLVVLHETGPLAPLLSRAVVLRHGRVVHDGPPPPAAPGHDGVDHEHLHPHAEDEMDHPGSDNALRVTPRTLP